MIKLGSAALKADPAPFLEALRREGAVGATRLPLIGAVRITSTHAAAEAVLKDRIGFVSNPATADLKTQLMPRWLPKRFQLLAKNMLLYDEPDHRRLRSCIDQAFARRGVAGMRAALEEDADRLIARLDPHGFELVSGLAQPVPLRAISELMGLSADARHRFESLAGALSSGGSSLSLLIGLWRLGPLLSQLRRWIEQARAGVTDDVHPDGLLALLAAREGAEEAAIDEDELLGMILTLLIAGHETTTHLISGGVWALLSHPEELERLRSGDVLIEDAVEELLRWLSPVMVTKPRFAATDCAVEGAEISRGEKVMACLIAANHDPARWSAPERLDLERRPSGHLAFGAGIHFCLGLNLARLEAQIAIERLMTRYQTLKLASAPVWSKRHGLRGLTELRLQAS